MTIAESEAIAALTDQIERLQAEKERLKSKIATYFEAECFTDYSRFTDARRALVLEVIDRCTVANHVLAALKEATHAN